MRKLVTGSLILILCGLSRIASADDRYEDAWKANNIHPIFLKRIANVLPAGDPNYDWDMPNNSTPYVPPGNRVKGMYYETTNSEDLNPFFQAIAKKIKLRLAPPSS